MRYASGKRLKMDRAVLVYQAGLANVFKVACFNLSDYGRNAVRLQQADFRTCASFARGLQAAGVNVKVAACNQAGDIRQATWTDDLDSAPFRESFASVTDTGSLL